MLIKDLVKSVEVAVKSGVVPFIQGSPGIGKSDIVKQVANKYKLKLIDIRLSQCDPTDLSGLPKLNGNRAEFLPFNIFPIEGDELPEDKSGWLIFLDEINSASRAVQASAYKLVLDRMVGNHKLHRNVVIVCAGNKDSDNAITNQISTALRSRFITLTLEPDVKSWLQWAYDNNIDWRITAYINYKNISGLYDFDPDKTDTAYACPRSWAMLDKLIKHIAEDKLKDYMELLQGTIGNQASIFIEFCACMNILPKFEDILNGKAEVKAKTPGEKYLLSGFVINNGDKILTEEHAQNCINYLDEIGKEFSIPFFSNCIRKYPRLLKFRAVTTKAKEYSLWLNER
jgi:hypothetical protein